MRSFFLCSWWFTCRKEKEIKCQRAQSRAEATCQQYHDSFSSLISQRLCVENSQHATNRAKPRRQLWSENKVLSCHFFFCTHTTQCWWVETWCNCETSVEWEIEKHNSSKGGERRRKRSPRLGVSFLVSPMLMNQSRFSVVMRWCLVWEGTVCSVCFSSSSDYWSERDRASTTTTHIHTRFRALLPRLTEAANVKLSTAKLDIADELRFLDW